LGLDGVFPDFSTLLSQNFAGISCAKPAIMLAMTPRTGSTFLCSALREAGQSREPNEIFNPRGPAQLERDRRRAQSFAAYIASFAGDPDAAFIFKTGWHDAAPLAPALTRIFPGLRVIYLDRKNIAAQAVSQFRAEISGIWHARPGQTRQDFEAEGKFDLARISRIVQTMEQEKTSWEDWFAANRITPLRLEYRLLETDVREALGRIAGTMKLDLRPDLVAGGGTLKLADALSTDWTERVQRRLFNLG
jgi:trehalose 2-sulfotransferase